MKLELKWKKEIGRDILACVNGRERKDVADVVAVEDRDDTSAGYEWWSSTLSTYGTRATLVAAKRQCLTQLRKECQGILAALDALEAEKKEKQ